MLTSLGNVYEVKLIRTCFTCYYDHRRWKCHDCTRGLISWKRVYQKEIVMQMLFKDNDSSLMRHLHFHRQLAISIAWSTRSSGISSWSIRRYYFKDIMWNEHLKEIWNKWRLLGALCDPVRNGVFARQNLSSARSGWFRLACYVFAWGWGES